MLVRAAVVLSPLLFCNGESTERSPVQDAPSLVRVVSVCVCAGVVLSGEQKYGKKANLFVCCWLGVHLFQIQWLQGTTVHDGFGNGAYVLKVRRSHTRCDGYFPEHSEQPTTKSLFPGNGRF